MPFPAEPSKLAPADRALELAPEPEQDTVRDLPGILDDKTHGGEADEALRHDHYAEQPAA